MNDVLDTLRDLMGHWLSMPLWAHQEVAKIHLPLREGLDNLFVLLEEVHPQWYTDWCRANGHDPGSGPLDPSPTNVAAYQAAMQSPTLGKRWLRGMQKDAARSVRRAGRSMKEELEQKRGERLMNRPEGHAPTAGT